MNLLSMTHRQSFNICVSIFCIAILLPLIAAQTTTIKFSVFENQPANTPVGQLLTRVGYTYEFLAVSDLFVLDRNSGAIKTKIIIDREQLPKDVIDLLVIEKSASSSTQAIDVQIEIEDENDNSPKFPESSFELRMSEQIKVGSSSTLPSATDKDKGVNGVTSNYRIVSGNEDDRFQLSVTSGDQTSNTQVLLVVKAALDRETVAEYFLNISAEDGGNPVNFGYLLVHIVVEDYNDNAPVFHPSKYTPLVNETAPVGTVVVQVTASDADEGLNKQVTYKFKETSSTSYKEFLIDSRTGMISLSAQFSCYSESGTCFFIVEAKDEGNPPLSSQGYVTVMVADDNDHAPEISITLIHHINGYATVTRGNNTNEVPIAIMDVKDRDYGRNGNVTLRIVGGNVNSYFVVSRVSADQGYFMIKVNGSLNEDSPNYFTLIVEASDMGEPPLTSRASISIIVTEENLHAPVFRDADQSVHLLETLPLNSYVASLFATDADSGNNALLFYQIKDGNQNENFKIDPETGLITTARLLDYETIQSYTLNISVQDRAVKPFTSYAKLQISIVDINDNVPRFQFNGASNFINVPEDAPLSSTIYTFAVSDGDTGLNGTVILFFNDEDNNKYGNQFAFQGMNLKLIKTLDYESQYEYILRIVASDSGIAKLSSTMTLTINVIDVNDNVPVVYPVSYFVWVKSHFTYGTPLCYITAKDADSMDTNLTYSSSSLKIAVGSSSGIVQYTGDIITQPTTINVNVADALNQFASPPATIYTFPANPSDKPSFQQESLQFSISEDYGTTFQTKMVGTVTGSGIDYFMISNGDPISTFRIDSNGNIITIKALDRENSKIYNLTVVGYTTTGFAVCNVMVTVTDLNDNLPNFYAQTKTVAVYDVIPPYYVLTYLEAIDMDEGMNGNVQYFLSGSNQNLMFINSSTGALSIVTPSWAWPSTSLDVTVVAKDDGSPSQSSSCLVTIILQDTNDHSPIFDQDLYNILIPESTDIQSFIGQVTAIDADFTPKNNQILYSLLNKNFQDDVIIVFPDGQLYVTTQLDREAQFIYNFQVVATDNGIPPRSSFTTVNIIVTDVNDHAPSFPVQVYNMSLMENQPIGYTVGFLSAFDLDHGMNAIVFYRIDSDNPVSFNFSIDSVTGKIVSNVVFDRERASGLHTFDAIAFNTGNPSLSSTTKVSVEIQDLNDNPPRFLSSVFVTDISEASELDTTVIVLSANDIDLQDNAIIDYSILSGNEDDVFGIDPVIGRVFIKSRVDREKRYSYTLIIQAKDRGSPSLSSSTELYITIDDVNDVYPVFIDLTVTNLYVAENSEPGTVLFKLKAQDPDMGQNGAYIFSIISGNNNGLFGLGCADGRLYIRKPLDYEQSSVYVLVVTVSDGGMPSHSSTATLTVNVQDVNDNTPQFQLTPLLFYVSEASPIDYKIGKITAIDRDTQLINSRIAYKLLDPTAFSSMFKLNSSTGDITLAGQLDREATDIYRVGVLAHDEGVPQLTSPITFVTIIVTDVNDNIPLVRNQEALLLPLVIVPNIELVRLQASDADVADNAVMTFTLSQPDSGGLVRLNTGTGALSLISELSPSTVSLDIAFSVSNGGLKTSGNHSLRLIVQSSAENKDIPQFQYPSYSANIRESSSANQPLVHLVTISVPSTVLVEFWITGVYAGNQSLPQGRGLFVVDRVSGQVSTGPQPLDREATPTGQYEVEVTLMVSGASVPLTRSIMVFVTVEDDNDSPPKFLNPFMEVSVEENVVPVPSYLTTVEAQDPDLNSNLFYSLNSTHSGTFMIDSETGRVNILKSLDFESASSYILHVQVSDSIHTTDAILLVNVIDVNDNSPKFIDLSGSVYNWTLNEDTPVGTLLGRVNAIDSDSGDNGRVQYRLLNAILMSGFSVDLDTGLVFTTRALDYEQTSHYLLLMSASDSGSSPLSSTVSVIVNVRDVNDNPPLFDLSQYRVAHSENTTIGSLVVTVRATDKDQDPNNRITYYIPDYYLSANPNLPFILHPITGGVSVVRTIDRESVASYSFPIRATDSLFSDESQVFITVTDVNDSPPVFVSSTIAYVKENEAINYMFHTVVCTDPDLISQPAVYSIIGNSIFAINSISGQMTASLSLDREQTPQYAVSISCFDGKYTSIQSLTVNVVDVNDNTPRFSQTEWIASLSINSVEPFLRLTSTDLDAGWNGATRFFLDSNSSQANDFVINSMTGDLSSKRGLQTTFSRSQYQFDVFVSDLGYDPTRRQSKTSVKVTVDPTLLFCPPVFLDTPVNFGVTDPLASKLFPVQLGNVRARSCSQPSRLRYYLKSGQSEFKLNETSGLMSARSGLLMPGMTASSWILKANTPDTPLLSTDLEFTITRYTAPASPSCKYPFNQMRINEATAVGTVFGRLETATDLAKLPMLFQLLWTRESDKSQVMPFAIDINTGEMKLLRFLDRELRSQYNLNVSVVLAGLGGGGFRRGMCQLEIVVQDANDNAPVVNRQFLQTSQLTASVDQASPQGTFVTSVQAWDPDEGINGTLAYSIATSGGAGQYFTLDSQTGFLRVGALSLPSPQQLTLTVRIVDGGSRSTQIDILITILQPQQGSVDFISPTPSSNAQLTVPEDALIGHKIATFSASSSSSSFTITYQLVGLAIVSRFNLIGEDNGALFQGDFNIDGSTGVLSVNRYLWMAGISQYQVVVRATTTGSQLVNYRSIRIVVIAASNPASLPAPKCTQSLYQLSPEENLASGVMIGQISVVSGPTTSNVRFSQISGDNFGNRLILSSTTGEIYVGPGRLDQEFQSMYSLVVGVQRTGGVGEAPMGQCWVRVVVKGVSEMAPQFIQAVFSGRVKEGASVGERVVQVLATDADMDDSLTYSWVDNPGDKFAIESGTGIITVAGILDREQQALYSLRVKVTDSGQQFHTAGVQIEVLDVNDEIPVLSSGSPSNISVTLSRLRFVSPFVIRVQAIDKDQADTPNSKLSFALSGSGQTAFQINADTGSIEARSAISLQADQLYHVIISVSDAGSPPLASQSTLQIRVLSDRYLPVFTKPHQILPLSTDATVSQVVGQITARLSTTLPYVLQYTLSGGNSSSVISVDPSTGSLHLRVPGNSLTPYVYYLVQVTATITDPNFLGVTSLYPANCTLIVVPRNQNSPLITVDKNTATLSEDANVDTLLFTITVSDQDPSINGQFVVKLNPPSDKFRLVHQTISSFQVLLAGPLDYESTRQHTLTVLATDMGFPLLSFARNITVIVTDINDSPPTFSGSELAFYIAENSPGSTILGQLIATDKDSSPSNNAVSYTISGSDAMYFSIDTTTGILATRFNVTFDYETRHVYKFKATATNPPFSTVADVFVFVTGVNEFRATCNTPQDGYSIVLNSLIEPGTSNNRSVGQVIASDQDYGVDGVIQFSLFSTNPMVNAGQFAVSRDTGSVMVVAGGDQLQIAQTRSRVLLNILVANSGTLQNKLTSTCQVTIRIQDGNDPPVFNKPFYLAQIAEDTIATNVITVTAEDWDIAKSADASFVYRILSPSSIPFTIDPQSGVVSISGALDRESVSVYNLTIGAVDKGVVPLTGTTMLRIILLDVNDMGPEFIPPARLSIQEGLGSNAMVGSLVPITTDRDGPGNGGPFTYSLVTSASNIYASWFKLTTNGLLFTTKQLDREEVAEMTLQVDVTDSGVPPMTSRLTFTVAIDDVNDSPSFPRTLSIIVTQLEAGPMLGPVANIQPLDADVTGSYRCVTAIAGDHPPGVVLSSNCWLFVVGRVPVGPNPIYIRSNDGAHANVISTMTLSVNNILSQTAAEKSLIELVFASTLTVDLILPKVGALLSQIRQQIGTNDTIVFAGFTKSPGLLFTTTSTTAWNKGSVRSQLAGNLGVFAALGLTVVDVRWDLCSVGSPCGSNAVSCANVARFLPNSDTVMASNDQLALASPSVDWRVECSCKSGKVGSNCQYSNQGCPSNFCRNGGTCYTTPNGPACLCYSAYTGLQCENDVNECSIPSFPPLCLQGQCSNTLGGYRCQCQSSAWYGDRCNAPVNFCSSAPCSNGATCVPEVNGYLCRCRFGFYGSQCQSSAWGLFEGSYVVYAIDSFDQYTISMELATNQKQALIAYQKVDQQFSLSVILQDGILKMTLDSEAPGSSNPISVQLPMIISTGSWFRIALRKTSEYVDMSVSRCNAVTAQCDTPLPSECTSNDDGTGVTQQNVACPQTTRLAIPSGLREFFKIPGQLYLMGLPLSISPPLLSVFDLVGCLRRIVTSFPASSGSGFGIRQDSCPRPDIAPCSDPLQECGAVNNGCVDEWFQARCLCLPGYQPPNCTKGYQGFAASPNSYLGIVIRPDVQRKELAKGSNSLRRKRRTADDYNSVTTSGTVSSSLLMKVKSKEDNGVLLLSVTDTDNYSFLSIQNRYLVFENRIRGRSQAQSFIQEIISDSTIHTVQLRYYASGLITMDIDGVTTPIQWSSSHNPLSPTVTQMYVAGLPSDWQNIHKSVPNFAGCLSELTLNDEVLPISGLTGRYNVTLLAGSFTPGCDSGACVQTVCQRGFQCQEVTDKEWGTVECMATGALTDSQLLMAIVIPCILVFVLVTTIILTICCLRRRRLYRKHKAKPPGPMVGPHRPLPAIEKGFNLAYLNSVPGRPHSLANHSTNSTATTRSGFRQDNGSGSSGHKYITKHIDRELINGNRHQPDLLPPCDTVMILNGGPNHLHHMVDPSEDPYQLGPPEHYDLDRASSLAPSDVLHLGRAVPPLGRGVWPQGGYVGGSGSLHSSMGSRIYEKLGSQASTTASQDGGPRYPYAYRHRLQPRATPSPRGSGTGFTLDDMRRSSRRSPLHHSGVPLSPPSSAAPSIDSFTGSETEDEDRPHPNARGNPMVLGACLPPPLPSTLKARGSWRTPGMPSGIYNRAGEYPGRAGEYAASVEPMLGWETRYESLVGVFQDLACLPNVEPQEEYV